MADDAEEKLDKHDMGAEDYDGVPAPVREERYSGESLGDKHYHKGAEASSGEDNERVVGAIVILLEVHPPPEYPCGNASDNDKDGQETVAFVGCENRSVFAQDVTEAEERDGR